MDNYNLYNIEPIDKTTDLPLSYLVYNTIRKAIINMSLENGLKLNEVHIADQLGVSTTPVREAFRRLAKDDLVVIKPWRGATVKGYSQSDITQIFQCREVLAGLSARLCAENITDEEIAELTRIHNEWLASSGYKQSELNMQFHDFITNISQNKRLATFLGTNRELFCRDMYISGQNKIRLAATIKEHTEIFEAICSRNPRKAEDKMRRHIRNAFAYKTAREEYKSKQNKKIDSTVNQ